MPDVSAAKLLRDISPTVSVGILTANLMSLGSELSLLERTGVHLVHIDVMDGSFCPMMTVGPPFIKGLKTRLLKDVHLMIEEPLGKVGDYVAAGADILTVHPEAGEHVHRVLQLIRSMTNKNDPGRGIVCGVALNPGTPLETLEPLLDEVDLILILGVNPGWSGQELIPATFARIARVKQMISKAGREILLAVDGGITRKNIAEVAATDVDIVVTGSAVFDGKAAEENATFMLNAVQEHSKRAAGPRTRVTSFS
jgi:ribulose-phosphate 3-epimerase